MKTQIKSYTRERNANESIKPVQQPLKPGYSKVERQKIKKSKDRLQRYIDIDIREYHEECHAERQKCLDALKCRRRTFSFLYADDSVITDNYYHYYSDEEYIHKKHYLDDTLNIYMCFSNYSVLEKIILSHPYKTWHYKILSSNPNISFHFVMTYNKMKWDINKLLKNENIIQNEEHCQILRQTFPPTELEYWQESDYVSDYDDNDNNLRQFLKNIEKTIKIYNPHYKSKEVVNILIDRHYLKYPNIKTYKRDISDSEIINYLYELYPEICISNYYNYSQQYIIKKYGIIPDDFSDDGGDDEHIQTDNKLTEKIYLSTDTFFFRYYVRFFISKINNIEMAILAYQPYDFKFFNLNYMDVLSRHRLITVDILNKYPTLNWNYKALSYNDKLYKYALQNKSLPWDWDIISKSTEVNMKDILENFDINWNITNISDVQNKVSVEDILNHPEYKWNYLMCFYKRIDFLYYNFDLNLLIKVISLFKSFNSIDQLNINLSGHDFKTVKYTPELQNICIWFVDNQYYDAHTKLKTYKIIEQDDGCFDSLAFFNFTYILNLSCVSLEIINYILDNYREYVAYENVKLKSKELTYELLVEFDNYCPFLMAYDHLKYDTSYIKYITNRCIKNTHYSIKEVGRLIRDYI